MFQHLDNYAGDLALVLLDTYERDPREFKVNLGIGLYFDDQGQIPYLKAVQNAARITDNDESPCSYLPIEGQSDFRHATQALIFGNDHSALHERRVATIQTLGGSGALAMAASLIKNWLPNSAIWISDPCWGNHEVFFRNANVQVYSYPYYDPVNKKIAFSRLLAALERLPEKSVVLLQPSCHNPTGLDLSRDQWLQVIDLLGRKNLIPLRDMAYQGFGEGLDEDAWAVRAIANTEITAIVAQSFSKNFSLYGERCGSVNVVCRTQSEAERVVGQLKSRVLGSYGTPPSRASLLITTILQHDTLRAQWRQEISEMRNRIATVRQQLYDALSTLAPSVDCRYLLEQRGMFCYTGLTPSEVEHLRINEGIYLLDSGRLCMPGLNNKNIHHVAKALARVLNKRREVTASQPHS